MVLSATCKSADHLVRLEEDRRRDRETQGFCGLQIDGQLDFRVHLDRDFRWIPASENLVHQAGQSSG